MPLGSGTDHPIISYWKRLGIDDVMFCHYGLFVAGAESFESTMKMASIAIQEK